ncbi:uncharacterized protein LOC121934720 [Sceloporus undulatus]|uniref:uncharacterized protein LOC121934720 n=1 Tax=Sceloporus undulatus TaxID=8520 RepID=UPI001C4CC489|nr:uncharacterized protein LOC121934720 [Sceloporus undulatus]
MMETDVQFMIKILEELDQNEMRKLKSWMNTVGLNEERIPEGKLEDSDVVMMAKLIWGHFHPKHLEALQHGLEDIPNKPLVKKVSNKIEAAKKEHGNQTEEVDGAPAEKLNFTEQPSYKGDFRLSDMEVYATENQDLLIKDLKEHLEPSAFKILEEDLARRALKNAFMFTGPQYYTLLINEDIKCFFDNVIASKKSQKVPSKILDILFFPNKNKRKREAVDEQQSNLLSAQKMSQPRDKKPVLSSPFSSTGEQKPSDERKELPTNKEKEDAQIFKEDTFTTNDHGSEVKRQESLANNENNIRISTQNTSTDDLDVNYDDEEARDYKKELPANKQKQISKVGTFAEYRDVDCDVQKPVYESKKNTASKKTDKVPENERYKALVRAIGKHYKEKRYCLDLIGIRHHKKYHCFIAQDVLLFRLAEETEYRILRSLQDKKDLTSKDKPKKNVEFELQFNMAILGIQCSELLSDNILHRVKARFFRESEEFLENIVSLIVLPVLALYKRVKLDTLQSLGATKDILLPRMEQQKATQIHVRSA